jgi:hypothetical protein
MNCEEICGPIEERAIMGFVSKGTRNIWCRGVIHTYIHTYTLKHGVALKLQIDFILPIRKLCPSMPAMSLISDRRFRYNVPLRVARNKT